MCLLHDSHATAMRDMSPTNPLPFFPGTILIRYLILEDAVGMTEEGLELSAEARGRLRAGGLYLRNLRESQEITRAELAEQLLSVTEALVTDIEAGHVRLPADDMNRWALALGVRRDEMADALGRLYDPLPFDTYWTRAAA